MAHDQIHEQLNGQIKGDGDFVGLTERPAILQRRMVSAPKLMRIVAEVKVQNDKPT